MKVYALCPECDDSWYGFSQPSNVFSSAEKAKSYLENKYKNVEYTTKRYIRSMEMEIEYEDTIFAICDDFHNYAIVEHEVLN